MQGERSTGERPKVADAAMVERVARAIANRRGARRGAPEVSNVLVLLKVVSGGKLYDEVMDDARAAIAAMREPTEAMLNVADHISAEEIWRAMVDAALAGPAGPSDERA